MVCRVEAYGTPCFTGLYINNGVNGDGGGFVLVANGNGNGWLRVSLNGNGFRVYSVVATIPFIVWIPALGAYFTIIGLLLWRGVGLGTKQVLQEPRVISLGLLLALSVNTLLVGAVYVDQATPRYSVPGISIDWSFDLETSTVTAKLNLGGMYTLLNATCKYLPPGATGGFNNNNNNNRASWAIETQVVNTTTVVAIIPRSAYEEYFNSRVLEPVPPIPAYLSVYEAMLIHCEFRLDKGVFRASYVATFYWRDLSVHVNGSRVVIYNPNPVSINTTLHIVDLESRGVVYSGALSIEALSREEVDLANYGPSVYRVVVQYILLGLARSRVVEVAVP